MIRLYIKGMDPIVANMEYSFMKKLATNSYNYVELSYIEALFISKGNDAEQVNVVYDEIYNQFIYKEQLLFFEEIKKGTQSYDKFHSMFEDLKKESKENKNKPKKEIIVN